MSPPVCSLAFLRPRAGKAQGLCHSRLSHQRSEVFGAKWTNRWNRPGYRTGTTITYNLPLVVVLPIVLGNRVCRGPRRKVLFALSKELYCSGAQGLQRYANGC